MQIVNSTRRTTLASQARGARTFLERMRGLMFTSTFPQGSALLLEPEGSIHTFFMRFPLDVIYLDREHRVVRITQRMRANRAGPLYTRGCRAVLELPAGVIAATRTEVGDQLSIKE